MTDSAGGGDPPIRVDVPGGQGVQVGAHNKQHNTYIHTNIENQVIKPAFILMSRQVVGTAPMASVQLPGTVVGFTGRDDELAVLAGLLDPARSAEPVVVSAVAGLPGVGKTTLAVEAGHAARGQGWFAGGVLFINLHGYDEVPLESRQALEALLLALGVTAEYIPPGLDERAALYRSLLAETGEPVLIIADNASSEAQVHPLLPGCGPHKVVVTSRHTLAGLGARLVDVTVLDDDEGVDLLATALRAARPEDDRITRDPEAARRLARLCGGLPLALQICAALLKCDPTLSAAELAGQLAVESERLEKLRYDDGSGPGAPSVAAAFELSYRRLEPLPARVFRLLPIDPGPNLSTAAAAHLADLPVSKGRGVLADLARGHLIEAAPGGGGRWRMHDLLRLYAQKLSDDYADADHREDSRDRLFAYYMKEADDVENHLQMPPNPNGPGNFTARDAALRWFDTERANLVAIVKMAEDTSRHEVACRLPIALARCFNWRRRFDDWLVTTRVSLNAARRLGDRLLEGVALNNLGVALRELRRVDEAINACQDAAAIFRDTGERHGEAKAHSNLGSALHEARRFDEAITAHLRDLAICKETGDRHGEAEALNNRGLALCEIGRFDEAITDHEEAATIYREIGDRHGEGRALNNLGVAIPKVWPQVNEAISALQRAAVIFRDTGDRHGEGMSLNNLGTALRELGWSLPQAIVAHEDAAAIFREIGDQHAEGIALNNLGVALAKGQRLDEAVAAHQNAARIFTQTNDQHAEGNTLNNLSIALTKGHQFREAIVVHQKAVRILQETGDRHAEGIALNRLGIALREVRSFQKAIAAHRKAARIFKEISDRHAEGNALDNLGLGLLKIRRFNEAISVFERAIALYEETGDWYAERQAQSNADYARSARQAF